MRAEELVRDRGGLPRSADEGGDGSGSTSAAFTCVVLEDEELLPLVARLDSSGPVLLLKEGRVGGGEDEPGSLAISEAEVAAALDAALDPQTEWERDPDLGVEVISSPVEGVAEELLTPRFLYRRADRIYQYAAAMPDLLARYPSLPGPERTDRSEWREGE